MLETRACLKRWLDLGFEENHRLKVIEPEESTLTFVKNRIEDRMEAEMTVSGMEDVNMAAAAATRRNSADRSCLSGPRNTCNAQG